MRRRGKEAAVAVAAVRRYRLRQRHRHLNHRHLQKGVDLTKWDFNKADCRTRCRKLIENSKPLLLIGSPIVVEETRSKRGRFCTIQTVVDFKIRFPDTFQTVTDRGLFGKNTLTRWLTNSGCIAQVLVGTGKPVAIGQTVMKAMSQRLQTDLCDAAATDQPQHRPLPPKLGILAVDPDEELQEK